MRNCTGIIGAAQNFCPLSQLQRRGIGFGGLAQCGSGFELIGRLRLYKNRDNIGMRGAQARFKINHALLDVRRFEFVGKFKAERNNYLLRRKMQSDNGIGIGDAVGVFGNGQNGLHNERVCRFANQQTFGFVGKEASGCGQYKPDQD